MLKISMKTIFKNFYQEMFLVRLRYSHKMRNLIKDMTMKMKFLWQHYIVKNTKVKMIFRWPYYTNSDYLKTKTFQENFLNGLILELTLLWTNLMVTYFMNLKWKLSYQIWIQLKLKRNYQICMRYEVLTF